MKIGIIDDGLDQMHPVSNPTGFTHPAGFPKGTPFTTPKVIYFARVFAPTSETWRRYTPSTRSLLTTPTHVAVPPPATMP